MSTGSIFLLVVTFSLATCLKDDECGEDKYFDHVTQMCHPCAEYCGPPCRNQNYCDKCEEKCPDFGESDKITTGVGVTSSSSVEPTDRPKPPEVQKYLIILACVVLLLIIVLITAISCIIKRRKLETQNIPEALPLNARNADPESTQIPNGCSVPTGDIETAAEDADSNVSEINTTNDARLGPDLPGGVGPLDNLPEQPLSSYAACSAEDQGTPYVVTAKSRFPEQEAPSIFMTDGSASHSREQNREQEPVLEQGFHQPSQKDVL